MSDAGLPEGATDSESRYGARRKYFGDVALQYESVRQKSLYDRWKWNRENAAVARALAELGPDGRILDVPVGTGRLLQVVSSVEGVHSICGADVSLDMLQEARRRVREGASCALVCAEAERLPFRDGSFDLVVSLRFFQHLPGDALLTILGELVRVSRRGVLLQAPLTTPLSPVVRFCANLLRRFAGGRSPSPRPDGRFFPTSRPALERVLAGRHLHVGSARVVTWRGGQLRLVHVHD